MSTLPSDDDVQNLVKHTRLHECALCGMRYPIVPYYPAAAPHGPYRCTGTEWRPVTEASTKT